MRIRHWWIIVFLGLILTACGSRGPKYSAQDIQEARQSGQLNQFYERLKAESTQNPRDKKLKSLLEQARLTLAKDTAASIRAQLEDARIGGGFVPLRDVNRLYAKAVELASLDATLGRQLMDALVVERKNTEKMMDLERKRFADPSRSWLERVEAAQRWHTLSQTEDSEKRYLAFKEQAVKTLLRAALEAMDAQDYGRAQKLLEMVKKIAPEIPNLEARLAQAEAGLSNQNFTELLEQGKVESAYQLMKEAAHRPGFERFRQDALPMAKLMENYFVKQGAAWTKRKHWWEAFTAFRKAHQVRRILGLPDQSSGFRGEMPFLRHLWSQANKLNQAGRYGHAYGLLAVMVELAPKYPGLPAQLQKIEDSVAERAKTGLSLSAFEDLPGKPGIGAGIVSRVTRQLLEKLPHDVKVLEREQLETILQERAMTRNRGGKVFVSADYFIEGRVVDARVEQSDSKGTERRRVPVRYEMGQNPEWLAWKRNGRNGPEPPKMAKLPVMEDVTIHITHHRKVALLTVSFRIIEAATAKVVYTDTVKASKEVTGRSVEGITIGEYHQPSEFARLPTDLELLDTLASSVAERVGDQLLARFKDVDLSYQQKSAALAKLGNLEDAAEYQAWATVIRKRKGVLAEHEPEQLRELALKALSGR